MDLSFSYCKIFNFPTLLTKKKIKKKKKKRKCYSFDCILCWKVLVFRVTLEMKIIHRKLHADFQSRLPIRFAFYDFANPQLG